MFGHTQSQCSFSQQNLGPAAAPNQNEEHNANDIANDDEMQYINMEDDVADNNINSAADTNGSSSIDVDLMPQSPIHHALSSSLELLGNQILGLTNTHLQTAYSGMHGQSMPQLFHLGQMMDLSQFQFSNQASPMNHMCQEAWMSQLIHLGSETTMFKLPPSINNTHLPMTEYRHQSTTAVEPYVPMPISQGQARLIQGGENSQLYMQNNDGRIRRPNRQLGSVLREPSDDPNQHMRHHGHGKRTLEQSDLEEARKKKKMMVTDTKSDDDSSEAHTISPLDGNPNYIGESSNAIQPIAEPTVPPLLGFKYQNFPRDLHNLGENDIIFPTENLGISTVGHGLAETLQTDDNELAGIYANPTENRNIARLGPPPAQSSANRPNSNGVCITRLVPIGALPHEIYNGGRG